MKIGIGSDHVGCILKSTIIEWIKGMGHEVEDYGTYSKESCDYPDYAKKVAEAVQKKDCDLGVLICGTGVGISIAANKVKGIRAACVSEIYSAKMSREHNNANIICFGARVIGEEVAKEIVRTFLTTPYAGERHQRRVEKISKIEMGQ